MTTAQPAKLFGGLRCANPPYGDETWSSADRINRKA